MVLDGVLGEVVAAPADKTGISAGGWLTLGVAAASAVACSSAGGSAAVTVLSRSLSSSSSSSPSSPDLSEISRLAISVTGSPGSLSSDEPRIREAEEFGSRLLPESPVVSMTLPPTGVMGDVVGVLRAEVLGVFGDDLGDLGVGDLRSSSVSSA